MVYLLQVTALLFTTLTLVDASPFIINQIVEKKTKTVHGKHEIPMATYPHWGYFGDNGPDNWMNLPGFSECGNDKQSPIDLANATTTSLPNFNFLDYSQTPEDIIIYNVGHSVGLEFYLSRTPVMSGGGLPGTFNFHHIHFHWGSISSQGSEHTVNGTGYPMGMHMVHWNSRYATIEDALYSGAEDALAVLGFLFSISDTDNPALDSVIESLQHVHVALTEFDLPTASLFPVDSLFSDTSKFYRYSGSLTTPACNEIVVWTVVEDTIPISEAQMGAFRLLEDPHHVPMSDNYRPVQDLNGRTLYYKE